MPTRPTTSPGAVRSTAWMLRKARPNRNTIRRSLATPVASSHRGVAHGTDNDAAIPATAHTTSPCGGRTALRTGERERAGPGN